MKTIQTHTILLLLTILTTVTSCNPDCDCDSEVERINFPNQSIFTSSLSPLNDFAVGDSLRVDIQLPNLLNDVDGVPRLIDYSVMDDYTIIPSTVERSDLGQMNYQPYDFNNFDVLSYTGSFLFNTSQIGDLGIYVQPSDPTSDGYRFVSDIIFTETGRYRFRVTAGITFFTNEDVVDCGPIYIVPFVFQNQNSDGYIVVEVN